MHHDASLLVMFFFAEKTPSYGQDEMSLVSYSSLGPCMQGLLKVAVLEIVLQVRYLKGKYMQSCQARKGKEKGGGRMEGRQVENLCAHLVFVKVGARGGGLGKAA